MERTMKEALNNDIEPMLGPVQLCQLSGWKKIYFSASYFRNKNVLKVEAGMLEKIRTF